jgi:hypothetical protein
MSSLYLNIYKFTQNRGLVSPRALHSTSTALVQRKKRGIVFAHESFSLWWSKAFRDIFGDDRQDYTDALKSHYQKGAPNDWQSRYVSSYASAHPWEDWLRRSSVPPHLDLANKKPTTCRLRHEAIRVDAQQWISQITCL